LFDGLRLRNSDILKQQDYYDSKAKRCCLWNRVQFFDNFQTMTESTQSDITSTTITTTTKPFYLVEGNLKSIYTCFTQKNNCIFNFTPFIATETTLISKKLQDASIILNKLQSNSESNNDSNDQRKDFFF
jgi:hypothetical protein